MIITAAKVRAELLAALSDKTRLFLVGCGACATVCRSGGEDEVFRLQEELTALGKEITGSMVIEEACHIMRAGRDLRQHQSQVEQAEALVVLACGAGVQSLSANTDQRVIAGLDSLFLGNVRRLGQYEERCSLCGECLLNETAGICPVTNCAKGILNGPCGGMEEGRCEADRDLDCAWQLIYQRLTRQGRAGVFARTVPPKNWGRIARPGRRQTGR